MKLKAKITGKVKLDADEMGKRILLSELKKRAPEIENYLHLIKWEKVGDNLNANFENLPIEIVRKINGK